MRDDVSYEAKTVVVRFSHREYTTLLIRNKSSNSFPGPLIDPKQPKQVEAVPNVAKHNTSNDFTNTVERIRSRRPLRTGIVIELRMWGLHSAAQ